MAETYYSVRAEKARLNLIVDQMKITKGHHVNLRSRTLAAVNTLQDELDTVFSIKEIVKAENIFRRI